MRTLRSLVLAGGMLVGLAGQAPAQLNINVGNPLNGQAFSVTTPGLSGGYVNTFGGVGTGLGYSSGYSGYSNYGGLGLGGYSNYYSGYSNTGFINGTGVIGQTYGYPGYARPYGYGYNSGYSGVGYVNPYGYRPYGSYGYGYNNYARGYGGFRPVNLFNAFRRF